MTGNSKSSWLSQSFDVSMLGDSFAHKVYKALLFVPSGKVVSYGDLAKAAFGEGFKGYQAIGRALNANPYAPKVPCHRVVKGDGSLGGFAFGCDRKKEMLLAEGIEVNDSGRIVDFETKRFRIFDQLC